MAEANSTTTSVNNGVNVAALIAAREALTNAPQAAQFKWRAACEWKNGTHSHSTVEGFYGLGQEQRHKRTFTFDADHPELFASSAFHHSTSLSSASATASWASVFAME
jgi:hypothetical protein